MKVRSSFTQPHVVPRMLVTKYFLFPLTCFFIHTVEVNGSRSDLVTNILQRLLTLFKNLKKKKKKVIEFWNNMRMMTECSFLGELFLEVAFNTKPLKMCHV